MMFERTGPGRNDDIVDAEERKEKEKEQVFPGARRKVGKVLISYGQQGGKKVC